MAGGPPKSARLCSTLLQFPVASAPNRNYHNFLAVCSCCCHKSSIPWFASKLFRCACALRSAITWRRQFHHVCIWCCLEIYVLEVASADIELAVHIALSPLGHAFAAPTPSLLVSSSSRLIVISFLCLLNSSSSHVLATSTFCVFNLPLLRAST